MSSTKKQVSKRKPRRAAQPTQPQEPAKPRVFDAFTRDTVRMLVRSHINMLTHQHRALCILYGTMLAEDVDAGVDAEQWVEDWEKHVKAHIKWERIHVAGDLKLIRLLRRDLKLRAKK